jgi:hypothetical protein
VRSAGLTPLDEKLADAMASEGGRSAQVVEAHGGVRDARPTGRSRRWIWIAVAMLGACTGAWAVERVRRRWGA